MVFLLVLIVDNTSRILHVYVLWSSVFKGKRFSSLKLMTLFLLLFFSFRFISFVSSFFFFVSFPFYCRSAVLSIADIEIWKQISTPGKKKKKKICLCLIRNISKASLALEYFCTNCSAIHLCCTLLKTREKWRPVSNWRSCGRGHYFYRLALYTEEGERCWEKSNFRMLVKIK